MKNIIYDGEYYYLFRALSKKELEDLENNKIDRLRTNCLRNYEMKGKWGKYREDSSLSLEEVYDHIKIRHRYDTNCISMTRDSNVALTYNRKDTKYAIVQVSPEELKDYFEAGEFFKDELTKKIEEITDKLPLDSSMLKILQYIDDIRTKKELLYFVNNLSDKDILKEKNYFNEDEQLTISKMLVKLFVLEQEGLIGNIVKGKSNSEIVKAMHNAYASSEFIHYGTIPKEKVFLCSKIFIDIFSLIQQKEGLQTKELEDFTKQVIELIREKYDIKVGNKAWLANKEKSIELEKNEIEFLLKKPPSKKILQEELNFSRAYKLTEGRISFRDTNMQITAIRLLAEMKLKQKIIVKLFQNLFPGMNILGLLSDTYLINPDLATKQNGKGHTISGTVNIIISELGYDISQENIEKILKGINELETEELIDIYENGINSGIINQLLVEQRSPEERINMDKNTPEKVRYITEAILEGYDWRKIGRRLIKEEKNKLAKNITRYVTENNELLDLYTSLAKIWIQNKKLKQEEIFAIIINIAIDKKLGDVSYKNLLKSNNKSDILAVNIQNLRTTVEPIEMDILMRRGKRIKALKQELIDLGIEEEFIEQKDIRNIYMAKRIVDEYEFERELTQEERKAILYSILNYKQLNKMESRTLLNLVKGFKQIGLTEQETYGLIINLAINSDAIDKFGYHYSMLLHSPSKILELSKDIKTLNTKVGTSNIQRAVIDNMDEEEQQRIKNEVLKLGIDEAFIEQKDMKNVCMAKKIIDEYNFGTNLTKEEKRTILQSILGTYSLDKMGHCYLINLVNNLEAIELSQQEAYGAIINLAINSSIIKEVDFSYDSLLTSSKRVKELAEYREQIDCKVGPVTIQVALIDKMSDNEIEKEIQELIELGIDKEFIEQKETRNVCMAKRIVEGYDFKEKLTQEEKRAIIQQMLKSIVLNKRYGAFLTTLANNLEKEVGLTEQEVYGTMINLGINGSVVEEERYYYTDLLQSIHRVMKLSQYKEKIESEVRQTTIQTAMSDCISKQQAEEIKQELINLGIDEAFIEQKDIKNIYIAKTIVEGYDFGREITLEEKKALLESILRHRGLNNDNTAYLTALTRNFLRIELKDQEIYGAMINLATNESIVEPTGYGYYKLIMSPKKIMEMKDYKDNIDCKVKLYTMQRAIARNMNEQEVRGLKQYFIDLGLDEKFIEQKYIDNLFMAKKIVEGYSFEEEITTEEKRAILQSILGQRVLDTIGYLISLATKLNDIGLTEQEIYGAIINLAINGSITEEVGYDYSKLLRNSSKVAELVNYKLDTKVSSATIKKAQEKAERIMKRALKKLVKEGKIEEISDTNKKLNDLIKLQEKQRKEHID